MSSTFPRSSILVLTPTSIHSLVPSTIISQVSSLIDTHQLEDALALADQRKRRLEGNLIVNEDDEDEMRYVYQLIGIQCFAETRFEDAGKALFNGDFDPRVIISYFPDVVGRMFGDEDGMDVFRGVEERMPSVRSVDDLITKNLVRNYSPHLAPSSPPTAELFKILKQNSLDMLETFLRKWRTKRAIEREAGGRWGELCDPVVDTVLTKVYARSPARRKDLYALISDPSNSVVLSEVEPELRKAGLYNALCMLFGMKGGEEGRGRVLDLLKGLVEGTIKDDDVLDPLERLVSLVVEKKDRALTQKWGLWLVRRDLERGLKLLIPRETGKRREKPEEDIALLDQIEEANPAAGVQYLEYLVLRRRSNSRELHTRLAIACIDQVLGYLRDDVGVLKLWRAKAASFASSTRSSPSGPSSSSSTITPNIRTAPNSTSLPRTQSFLAYYTSTTPDSPHKRARLKTILVLSLSELYDPDAVRRRLDEAGEKERGVLVFERALLEGKTQNHRAALELLVHELQDPISAEAYCTLGGEVVSERTLRSAAESAGLVGVAMFAAVFSNASPIQREGSGQGGRVQNQTGVGKVRAPTVITRQKTVDEGLKKELLKVLLEVYMDGDDQVNSERATHLLNSQAVNLDVVDVIELVPPLWPVNGMASFLVRSFRRTQHALLEGKIVKNICVGQNLEVKDRSWKILRDEGAVIEEADAEDELEDEEAEGEKVVLSEKIAEARGVVHALRLSVNGGGDDGEGEKRNLLGLVNDAGGGEVGGDELG